MRKRRHYRRKRKNTGDDNSIRLLILSFIILLAVIFKTVTGVSAVTVLKELSMVVTGKQSYSEVVSTIGKAISEGAKENVIAVFGGEKSQITEGDEVEYALPIVKDPTEETEETTKGRSTAVPAFSRPVKITQVEFLVNDEEYIDDTQDKAFEIPVPDNADNGKYEIDFEYARPCGGRITSPFGYRVHPITQETTFHYGIDLAAAEGSAIYAFADGKVIERGNNSIFGNYVKIEHKDGFVTFYGHLSGFTVKKGEAVKIGEEIGKAGATGTATGPHLHFEVRKNGRVIDPAQYIG